MIKMIKLGAFSIIIICLWVSALYAPWVKGYHRKDGTYVPGYWRSEPNEYKFDNRNFNNWSSPYLTDWYNQSYFQSKEYYKQLKELEKALKSYDEDEWLNPYRKKRDEYDYDDDWLDLP